MVALSEESKVESSVTVGVVGLEEPGKAGGWSGRNYNGVTGELVGEAGALIITSIGFDEARAAAGGVGVLFGKVREGIRERVPGACRVVGIQEDGALGWSTLGVGFNPIGNELGIAEAMGMVGLTFLDDCRDGAAVLVVQLFGGESVVLKESIFGAADEQEGDLVLG